MKVKQIYESFLLPGVASHWTLIYLVKSKLLRAMEDALYIINFPWQVRLLQVKLRPFYERKN